MHHLAGSLFLFDVDGVLTDESARVDHPLLSRVAGLAGAGAALALISGRSRTWLETNILPDLAAGPPSEWMQRVLLAAEMGAVCRQGLSPAPWTIDEEFVVPDACRAALRDGAADGEFAPFIEWDATKEATATVEARHAPGDREHTGRTREALAAYQAWAEPIAARAGCRTAMSTYALDVLRGDLSKRVAVDAILRSLPAPAKTYVFGDSPGDLRMADAVHEHGLPVALCWVGPGAPPGTPYPVRRCPAALHNVATGTMLSAITAADG